MNIHEAIDYLMEKDGNAVAVFFCDEDAEMRVFSGSLPSSNSISLWVKHKEIPHPVPFSINSDLMAATFIQVSGGGKLRKAILLS